MSGGNCPVRYAAVATRPPFVPRIRAHPIPPSFFLARSLWNWRDSADRGERGPENLPILRGFFTLISGIGPPLRACHPFRRRMAYLQNNCHKTSQNSEPLLLSMELEGSDEEEDEGGRALSVGWVGPRTRTRVKEGGKDAHTDERRRLRQRWPAKLCGYWLLGHHWQWNGVN